MNSGYDKFDYPEYWVGREYEDGAEKIALRKLFSLIPQRESLIDIGAGFGRHAPAYAPLFRKCLLVDPAKELLGLAKNELSSFGNLEYVVGGGQKIPAPSESFSAALLIRVIHHLEKPEETFAEIKRILKPGGYFVLEFANKLHFLARIRAYLRGNFDFAEEIGPIEQRSRDEDIHFLNYHPLMIKNLLGQSGFSVVKTLSVSNFRFSLLKKAIPLGALLHLEKTFQKPLARNYFGPSIFFLAHKKIPE